jgi:hypothetical protein
MSKASSSSSVALSLPTQRIAWRSFAESMELPSLLRPFVRWPAGYGFRNCRADGASNFRMQSERRLLRTRGSFSLSSPAREPRWRG